MMIIIHDFDQKLGRSGLCPKGVHARRGGLHARRGTGSVPEGNRSMPEWYEFRARRERVPCPNGTGSVPEGNGFRALRERVHVRRGRVSVFEWCPLHATLDLQPRPNDFHPEKKNTLTKSCDEVATGLTLVAFIYNFDQKLGSRGD